MTPAPSGLCPCCRTRQPVAGGRIAAHRTPTGRPCLGTSRRPATPPAATQTPPEITLTPAQTHLLNLLESGLTQPQIAARLGIGQSSTSLRVTGLRGQLAALLQQAARQGLITPDQATDLTPGRCETRWPALIADIDAVIGDWLRPAIWRVPPWRDLTPDAHPPTLTPAQVEVLALAADGLTQPQIARRRGVTLQAVYGLIRRARHALDAPTVADAVRAARHHHHLPTPPTKTDLRSTR